jgi:hypothetical protein
MDNTPNNRVIFIAQYVNNSDLVYDTIERIKSAFQGVILIPVVVEGDIQFFYAKVDKTPTEGVNVITNTNNSPPSADKLNLFRITTNNIDYRVMNGWITKIMNILKINIERVKDIIANIIIYGPTQETWPKNGGKKRYLSSRKSHSSSRRRRSTKRRTTSRKQQKRRRGSRRAH